MTSLNGNGFSISLLRLVDTGLGKGKSILELLDAPHEALGWPAIVKPATWENKTDKIPSDAGVEEEIVPASKLKSGAHIIDIDGHAEMLMLPIQWTSLYSQRY